MSTPSENELDLELHFLPAWAKQSPDVNRYAQFQGEPERGPRRGRDDRGERRGERRDAPPRRPGPGAPRRDAGPGGNRPGGGRPDRGAPRGYDQRRPREERREPLVPLPELKVEIVPEEKGVESIARQIKLTGRAYPLFEIASLILKKPERYHFNFAVVKKPDGTAAQPLFACSLDDTLWLSEQEAVTHVLGKHFSTFYQAERTPCDPPKGIYTFVAQCGMSGAILGPPNYHDYQNNLRKLHTERFAKMPFDAFKSRVKIVKDEAVVKKWIEDQSFKTEYICLNVPEPARLPNLEEVEKHFRLIHLPNVIKPVETHTITAAARRDIRSPGLMALMRREWDDQSHFPIKVANTLSRQFASDGLAFFKVNKTVTHVSVARPHYLDVALTPVSEGVSRILDFLNAHLKTTRRDLLAALAPTPVPFASPAPVPEPDPGATPAATAPAAAPPAEPTPEQAVVITDLHWLIHQGHVIEFANGRLETAKKPIPKPEKKPAAKVERAAATEAASAEVVSPAQTQPETGADTVVTTESEPPPSVVEPAPASPPVEEAPAP